MPYVVLMPIFADKILHGGARGLGILMGATGIGAFAGGVDPGLSRRCEGPGPVGGGVLRRVWRQPGGVFRYRTGFGFR